MSTRFVEEYDAWLKLRRKKLVDIYRSFGFFRSRD